MCSIQYEYGYKMNTIQPQKGRKFWHNLDEPRILSEIHCGGCSVAKSCPTLTTAWTAAFQASCPWLSPRVCSNSCPLNRWCHPIISSSVSPFSSFPQSFPASGAFPVSQLFTSGGKNIGTSASGFRSSPSNIQGWFPLGLTGSISLISMKDISAHRKETPEK